MKTEEKDERRMNRNHAGNVGRRAIVNHIRDRFINGFDMLPATMAAASHDCGKLTSIVGTL